jgi:hypothetical protein
MKNGHPKFTIETSHWYAWQMFPGYVGSPYCSPIWVRSVRPRKSGLTILSLEFWNVAYAQGVQNFALDLRVLKRTPLFLAAEIVEQPDRLAIVSTVTVDWLRKNFSEWVSRQPASDLQDPQLLLTTAFRPSRHDW